MSHIRMTEEEYLRRKMKAGASALAKVIDSAPTQIGATKPAKYRNKPTTDANGVKHASKKQATRYRDLGHLMKSGEILMLAREVRFRLPGGVEYRADHVYANQKALEAMAALIESGDLVIEDVKSEATRNDKLYQVKKRQMKECLGVEIREV